MLSVSATMAQDMGFVGTWGFSNDGAGGVLAWGTQDKGAIVVPTSATISGTTYSVTGIRHDFGDKCVNNYPGTDITSVQLPEGIISIGDVAFYGFTKVTTFNIPSTVTSFGTSAFEVMYALTTINSAMTTPVAINSSTLFYATDRSKVTLHIPFGTDPSVYTVVGWTGFGSIVADIGAPSNTIPDAPTAVSATAGNAQATVSFTAPSNNGGASITGYTITSNPGSISQSGASSPITLTGLTNGTAYTFTVVASNSVGNSSASSASNSVTPSAPNYIASTNVALGKTVTVSGSTASGAPSNLVDGILNDNNSRWRGDNTCTVDIDFGASQTISSVYINNGYTSDGGSTYDPTGMLTDFTVQSWNGSSWVNIPATSITGNTNPNLTIHFSSLVTTTKIRLNIINGSSDASFTRLYEIKVWTPNSVTATTSASSMGLTSASDIAVSNGGVLTIDSPTTINSLTIVAGGKVSNNSSLTASNLTINSDAIGTGTYVETGTSTITSANVQQYLPQGRNWYLSSPVTAGNTSSLIVSGAAASVSYYDEPTSAWVNNYTGILTSGKGYIAVSNSGTATNNVQFSGILNTGNVDVLLTKQGSSYAGFNLVANPYPSYLNPMAVINANSNLVSTIWYRTRSTGGTPTYYFETVNTSSGVGTNVAGTGTVTGYIPPMQAFWLKTNADAQTLTFTNSMRYHANPSSVTTTPLKAKSQINQPLVRLLVSNGTSNDEAIIYSNPNAQNGYDVYDSPKRSNNDLVIPEIFTTAGSQQLVINGLNAITLNQEISLGLTAGNSTNLSIKASQLSNLDAGTRIILRDYLDPNHVVEQDLTDGTSYNFTSATSATTTGRFAVIFKSTLNTTDVDHNNDLKINIFRNGDGQITINCPTELTGKAMMFVYNALGQKLENKLLVNPVTVLTNQLNSGVYFVNVMAIGKSITNKVVVN